MMIRPLHTYNSTKITNDLKCHIDRLSLIHYTHSHIYIVVLIQFQSSCLALQLCNSSVGSCPHREFVWSLQLISASTQLYFSRIPRFYELVHLKWLADLSKVVDCFNDGSVSSEERVFFLGVTNSFVKNSVCLYTCK